MTELNKVAIIHESLLNFLHYSSNKIIKKPASCIMNNVDSQAS